MSTMIERVARAIASNPPSERTEYRDSGPVIVRDFERTARAAIEAMRKPTQEMKEAVRLAGGTQALAYGLAAWPTMIDAALEDKP